MKILVVGGGGREHAIIKSLKKNPELTEIFACPGNGGIAKDATCTGIGATKIDEIVAFAVPAPSERGPRRWLRVSKTHRQGAAFSDCPLR